MTEIFTSILAGALAEVAKAATVGNVANAVIGNRADALLLRSIRAISAGFRYLSGSKDAASAVVIARSVEAAFQRSMARYIKTIAFQTADPDEQVFVADLRRATRAVRSDDGLPHLVGLADAVRPLLADMRHPETQVDCDISTPLVLALRNWCEHAVGPMPEAFERLLTEAAPDAGPPWIACFRDELAAELLKNPAFERLLMASNLSDAAESGAAIRTLARSLQSKLHTMDATLVGVDTKVDRIALHQDEQLAHLRQLNALLFQSGSPPSPEMSSRVLTGAMFGASGQAISTALIFVQIFGTYSPVDALGRETRSSLIREAHARLAEAAGEAAYVGRIDGGEFDIIMRDVASSTDATLCCDRIAQAFLSPFDAGGTPILLRPKMGVAISPEHGFAPEALQRNADLALRSALAYGSKDIVVYVPELRTDARDRKQLEIDLRRAIEANELHLVFQPVIELAGRRLVGYEALVRWVHPSRGPISPSTFVPIAEEAGLIVAIGDWALRTACVHATQWPDDVRVAVNISPIQFANPAFPSVVMSALADTGLSADRLELEITEGVFLAEGQTTSETFAALKKVGTRLVLDDFGTGYSSLGYLKQAPLDKIKIDQSFVRRVSVAGGRDAAIIRSIVGLAKALGMETTAEGIETEDELLLVEQLGCTYGQGYFFGRPHQA